MCVSLDILVRGPVSRVDGVRGAGAIGGNGQTGGSSPWVSSATFLRRLKTSQRTRTWLRLWQALAFHKLAPTANKSPATVPPSCHLSRVVWSLAVMLLCTMVGLCQHAAAIRVPEGGSGSAFGVPGARIAQFIFSQLLVFAFSGFRLDFCSVLGDYCPDLIQSAACDFAFSRFRLGFCSVVRGFLPGFDCQLLVMLYRAFLPLVLPFVSRWRISHRVVCPECLESRLWRVGPMASLPRVLHLQALIQLA